MTINNTVHSSTKRTLMKIVFRKRWQRDSAIAYISVQDRAALVQQIEEENWKNLNTTDSEAEEEEEADITNDEVNQLINDLAQDNEELAAELHQLTNKNNN